MTNGKRHEFYEIRDQRTHEYDPSLLEYQPSITITLDTSFAEDPAGQHLLLALVSQVARMFPRLKIRVPARSVPVRLPYPFTRGDLREMLLALLRRIDPFGAFTLGNTPSKHLGFEIVAPTRKKNLVSLYAGFSGHIGHVARTPVPYEAATPAGLRGASVSSCLAAASMSRVVADLPVSSEIAVSAWNLGEGDYAEPGPSSPSNAIPDPGRVLLVGGGAVASCFAYWASMLGMGGIWSVVDGDRIALSNTNRSLTYFPDQSEWDSGPRLYKANVLAGLLPNAKAYPVWFHELPPEMEDYYDLVLCLANSFDVRTSIAHRYSPVVLHATTGRNWDSRAHRHVALLDDCIRCRMVDIRDAGGFKCATASVPSTTSGTSQDAALPFLSAASGLLLYCLVERLVMGDLNTLNRNEWAWWFNGGARHTQSHRHSCRDGCEVAATSELLPSSVLRRGKWGSRIQ